MDNNFSVEEYRSLRLELIERIKLINTQSSTVVITVISAWAAGLTLTVGMVTNSDFGIANIVALELIRTSLFLIPIFYTLPLAIKSGENLVQQVSISAYIRVFYDYLLIENDEGKMNWETSNNLMSRANVDRGKRSAHLKMYNDEYTILAIFSLAFYMLFAGVSVYNLMHLDYEMIAIILIVVYIILGILSGYAIIIIHQSSCIKRNHMDQTKTYILGYIKRANDLGIISDEKIKDAWEKLNPENDIKGVATR